MRSKKHTVIVSALVCLIVGVLLANPFRLLAAPEYALQFDGVDDRVTFGTALPLGASTFTLELWFMRTGTGVVASTAGSGGISAVPLITKGRAEVDGSNLDMNYFLGIEPTKRVLTADFEDTATGLNHPVAGKTAICDNIWYHAAATYDGTTWRLYLNGELDAELVVGAFTPRFDSIQHAALGTAMTSTGAAQGFFKGQMDEVRIWNAARSQAAIQSTMGGPLPIAANLIGRWGLDEGTGTTATNSAGLPNGTLVTGSPVTPLVWTAGGSGYVTTPLAPGNYGMRFAGTVPAADYVTFGPATSTLGAAKFTVETWFRREAAGVTTSTGTGGLTAAIPLVTKGRAEQEATNVDMNYFLGINTAGANAVLAADFEEGATAANPGNNHPISGTTPILLNTWYHAAVTYDGTNLQLYLNGQPEGTAITVGQPPRADSIQHAALGSALLSTGAAAGFFAGTLDEARIWNYARTPQQMAASANREIPSAFGLLGRWSFNECCGRVTDSTGHLPNATLLGTGWAWTPTPALSGVVNTAPIVAAGTPLTVTLPALGSLTGSVVDDGANTGVPLSILWTKKSGPGSVSFGVPSSPATSASFSDLGTYVLTLTASDGDFIVSADITVTVEGVVNQPPSPNAGPDVTTVLPIDSVSLTGGATDDGLPGAGLSYQWSKVSGPGAVSFGNAAAASTSATFAAEGAYVLKLHVSDGLLAADDTVSVTVSPSASNSAIQFGGTNASVTFGPAPHLGAANFTIEAWIRRDGAGVATFTGTGGITAVPLVTKGMAETEGGPQDMNYFLGISGATGTLAADFEDTATGGNHPITGGTPITPDGRWHHVAATYDGTTWRLFLDGQPDGSLAVGAFTPRFDSIQHAALGTALNSAGVVTSGQTAGFFNGVLDEVRIWNYARSQAQIAGGLNREIASASGLLGRWGLNEGTGSIVADSSGGNVGGTVAGSNWSWVSGAHITGQPNAAPQVDAGFDATVTLPTPGMLLGLATDDGIGGGAVVTQWSQVSGPGTASFGNTASVVTTVDFSALGTYVLRLSASDGELSASDDVQITVGGVINQAPTVDAGADQAITLPVNVANLVGTVGDDGAPGGGVTMLWSTVSGPAGVVFSTPAAATTTATFAMEGTYVLRLSASDGSLSATDTVTVTVAPDAANKALKLLGTNAFVTLGPASSLGLQKFTIETWFRRDGAGVATFTGTGGVTAIPLITKGMAEVDQIDNRDMNYFLGIRQSDGVLVADFEDTATAANHPIAGATVIPVGAAWHHAAATYDGDTLRLYLDGALERELAVGLIPRFDSIQHAVLGGALNSTGGVGSQPQGFFNGVLDEARVWNHARSTGQIQRGRFLEIAQPVPGLVARWGMNETAGTQVGNSAGAGLAGDIIGTGWSRVSGAPFVGLNQAPAAADDSATTDEDASIVIAVLANDTDPDGDALSIATAGGAAHGSATVLPDGTVSYLPAANFQGSDTFTYTVSDGQGASAIGTVTVTVTNVNDAPAAASDTASTNEDTAVTISVLSNDSDGDGDAITPVIVSVPLNGAVVVNADGTIEYTPAPNFYGADGFTYKVSDGTAFSATVMVAVTVTGVNDAPVAGADSYMADEDASLQIDAPGLLGNDSDADEDPLSVTLVSGVAHGGLTLNADGSFVYTPDANFNGPDSFTYQVNDGLADSAVVTVSLTVRPVNDAPVAADDSYTTAEDAALVVAAGGVLSNDGDVDGDAIHAVLVTGPANGVLTLNADGSFTYTPNADFNGADGFSYKSGDAGEESAVAIVTITVSAVNDAPVAVADSYSVDEDGTLAVAGPGVLSNDTDVEGSTLSATMISGPSHGALTLNADGSFSYVPAADYHGADSFSYKADDGVEGSAVAVVSITVNPVNDAPVAGDDSYATVEDTALTIPAAGVLANDTDVDGMQTLQAVLVTGPAHGTLALDGNGGFVYTPTADYHGADGFTYKAGDGTADSNVATVTINVSSVNDAPVAVAESFSINEDTVLSVSGPGVLANDTDAEGTALTLAIVSGVSHGILEANPDGSFTYTPEGNFHGSDSFTYRAGDGTEFSNVVTVSIEIASVNDAPVAVDDTAGTTEDTPLVVAAPGVLGNDSDIDGTPLTAILVSGPAHGTVTLAADGSFHYEPAANYYGPDSFSYKVNDGSADSAVATMAIVVGDVSDAPVAASDAYTTSEDAALTVAAPGVLANDTNPDGGALTAVLVTGTAHGTLQLNANGSFSYAPAANYHGSDSFTYQASGAAATSNIVTVFLTVDSVPDAPVANPNSYTKNEDAILTVAAPGLLGNDRDGDGEPLSAVLVAGPSHGTVALNANGSFVYTPALNYNGPDSFTYRASDGTLLSADAAVTITVRSVNDAPVAVGDSYSVAEDGVLNIAAPGLLANDTDIDSGSLTASKTSNPAHGTVTVNADGSFSYRPAANYRGPDSFNYRARDASTNSNVATVSITVVPVDDAPVAASQSKSLNEDATRTITLAATDADGDALTYAIVTPPAHGVLTGAAPNVTYVPQANYNGPDSFTFVARDASLTSNVATVSLTVTPVNDAPVAQAAAYSTPRNNPFTGNLVASDADGNSLTYVVTTQPTKGVVLVNPMTGGFLYIPGPGKTGADSFRFRVNDGTTNSNTARIDITIR